VAPCCPAELERLALPQADERGKHDEELQPLWHVVEDDGQLVEGRRLGYPLDPRFARTADLRRGAVDELLLGGLKE
jgi:hypothetical protein